MNSRGRYLFRTLALVAIGLGYALVQGWPAQPAPHIEKSAAAARPPAPPLATARQMLDREAELSLTAGQRARLTVLDEEWGRDSAPVERALESAGQEFSQYMKEAQAEGKTNPQEIQRRSADYRELSAELRELRQRHAEAAANVLTEYQQRTLALLTSPQTRGGNR